MTYSRKFDHRVNAIIDFLRNDVLYHFTTIETAFEYIVANQNLRFGKIINVNDPKEFQINVPESILTNCGVICFSENKKELSTTKRNHEEELNDLGFYDPRMWAMYGQNHHGVCFVFSKNRLLKEFGKDFNSSRYIIQNDYVRYLGKNDIQTQLRNSNNNPVDATNRNSIASIMNNQLFVKHSAWKYENEYRLMMYDTQSAEYHYLYCFNYLLAIVLGSRVPDIYWKAINSVKPGNVYLARTYWKNGFADTPCFSGGSTLERARYEGYIDDYENSK